MICKLSVSSLLFMFDVKTWSRVLSVVSVMIMLQIVLVVSTNVCGSTNGNKFCTGSMGHQVCCGVNGICDVVYCSEPSLCQESAT